VARSFFVNIKEYFNIISAPEHIIVAVLQQFSSLGLCRITRTTDGFSVTVNAEAYDVFRRGGFVAQEQLLKEEIKKLMLEIEHLKPYFPEKINTLTSIIAELATALSLFR
jgi:hypothetical protein